jgi:hypothetical protein
VGTALRSFQPTIREVVEVSQEVKGTLERVRDRKGGGGKGRAVGGSGAMCGV